jgi:elongation factor G
MASYTTADIRNILLAGGPGSGKTTLAEAMLHKAGVIGRVGRVEDGNTVCDYDDIEKDVQHSLDSAIVHFDHDGAHVNLIDCPGSADFVGKPTGAMAAVETAVIVVDASAGVETMTRRMIKLCAERSMPRMIVINKIDNALDLNALVEQIQEAFGGGCRPINLPAGGGKSVVDCLTSDSGESDLGDVSGFHEALVEQIVEVDEALMEKYLEQGEVDASTLEAPLKQALREGHLVPVCFTSARDDVGVAELMSVIAKLCLNPADAAATSFTYDGGEHAAEPDSDKTPIAHVFKVSSDPFVGKLCVFRVFQGHIGGECSSCWARTTTSATRSWRATSGPWPRSTRSTTTR